MKPLLNVQTSTTFAQLFALLLVFFSVCQASLASEPTTILIQKKATAHLRCYVTYADQTQVIDTYPESSGYESKPVDIGSRFSFKAIMIEKSNKLDHIALYAYFQASPKNIPIHEAVYRGPFRLSSTPSLLTPYNHLYAGEVERELKYHCELSKITS